ncbi:MAG TPA: hypothetical protein VFX70_12300 [Mycobacteriales bacterium]|nr:hypothetical protein [Mycobacteriales bacterium]
MTDKTRRLVCVALGAVLAAGAVTAMSGRAWAGPVTRSSGPPAYQLLDLGDLGGSTTPLDMNDRDQVVGFSAGHPFLWDGRMKRLPTLGGLRGRAEAINEQGVVAGAAATRAGPWHASLWRDGRITDLGTLGGASSEAVALNGHGQVAGWSLTTDGETHPFLWQDGVMTDLGRSGEQYTIAGIDDRGDVVGSASSGTGAQFSVRAVLWRPGHEVELAPGTDSRAVAVNGPGQVVVNAFSGGSGRAFLWADGTLTDLGTLGGADTVAAAINRRGEVVGRSGRAAFRWRDGVMRMLPNPPHRFASAARINDVGLVIGTSANFIDKGRSVVLWRDGEVIELGPFPPQGLVLLTPVAVDSRGRVLAGWEQLEDGDYGYARGFLWTERPPAGTAPNLGR